MTEIEALTWDVIRARQRTAEERARVARYIAELMEPMAGTRLLVAVEPGDGFDDDVIRGPVLVPVRDDAGQVWTGVLLGNAVGAPPDEELMYSIVLFPFIGGRRPDRSTLRSISARLGPSGPEVWASGSTDEYGEWESIESPLDLSDFTLSPELATAAQELRLMPEDD